MDVSAGEGTYAGNEEEHALVDFVNSYREATGLSALAWDGVVAYTASQYSKLTLANGAFDPYLDGGAFDAVGGAQAGIVADGLAGAADAFNALFAVKDGLFDGDAACIGVGLRFADGVYSWVVVVK